MQRSKKMRASVYAAGALLMAGWLWIFNLVFAWFFFQIGVLES